jgi:hypothetical protein
MNHLDWVSVESFIGTSCPFVNRANLLEAANLEIKSHSCSLMSLCHVSGSAEVYAE